MNTFLGMSMVALCFAIIMAGGSVLRRRCHLHAELSRKLVHILMGLVTLFFPVLFKESWPVWTLSAAFVLVLSGIKVVPSLRQRFGQVLGGVERQSWGEFCFPLAVALVFSLAHSQSTFYIIPLLVLTLADASAALIGVRFGKVRYSTDEGTKTIEGSVALFFVAALSAGIPLALLGHGLMRAVITAICLGVLTALVEAIAWRGMDNLFLPLATLIILVRFETRSVPELIARLLVALGVLGFVLLWRQRTTLRDNALAGAALVLYVCYTLGGLLWLVPPLLVTMAYTFLPFHPQRLSPDVHGNSVMLSLAAAGLFWLFLDQSLHTDDHWLCYALSFATQLSMIFLARWKRGRPATPTWRIIAGGALAAWIFEIVPALLVANNTFSFRTAVLALAAIVSATALFGWFEGHRADMPNTARRWLLQTAFAFAGSAAGLLPIFKQ